MKQTLMTIGDMANRLAVADGVNSAGYFARQVRSFVQRGILEPDTYQGEGRTAAAVFGHEGLCEARIMTVLARMGFSPEQMLGAHRCMRNMSDSEWQTENAGQPHRPGLPIAIEGAKRGERWFLVLHLRQERFETSDSTGDIMGSFTRKPVFDNPVIQGLSLASVVLDCETLFQALLASAETAVD
jgi:hypothetical protein